jgi:hypothetical protein
MAQKLTKCLRPEKQNAKNLLYYSTREGTEILQAPLQNCLFFQKHNRITNRRPSWYGGICTGKYVICCAAVLVTGPLN